MNLDKIKFIILEGAEKSGKTLVKNTLLELNSQFEEYKIITDEPVIQRQTAEEKIALFDKFDKLEIGKVYILDRFILTDIVYNQVLRPQETTNQFFDLARKFAARYDVLCINLDRNLAHFSYQDDKIQLSADELNLIIKLYRYTKFPKVFNWSRQMVDDNRKAAAANAKQIAFDAAFAFGMESVYWKKSPLIQQHYTKDFWKFGISCILLNQTSGYRVRKVAPEFFYHFGSPRRLLEDPYNAMEIIKPLGMVNVRCKLMLQFTEDYLKNDEVKDGSLSNYRGAGKYFIDSYKLFVMNIKKIEEYSEPLDKELRKILEGYKETF